MKKLLILLLLTSCAIQGEVYRLQNRMENWYNLLTPEQKQLFVSKEDQVLGEILDEQEKNDLNFAENLRQVRIDEAIMSFSGKQTVKFYYEILLKDLAKFSYQEFMDSLDSEQKITFVNTSEFNEENKAEFPLSLIFDRARNLYGMNEFTDVQILNYYRHYSFPATVYPVIYEVLAFLARYRSLESLLNGDLTGAVVVFDNIDRLLQSRRLTVRNQGKRDLDQWNNLKKQMQFTDLSNEDVLVLIYEKILVEMNPEVVNKTISNIRNRFKEQQ